MATLHTLWNRFLLAGTTGQTSPNQRSKICITRGASFFLAALGPVFAALNLAQGYVLLAAINFLSTLLGLICLLLVRRNFVRAAAGLLVLGSTALFSLSGLLFRNGMEYTLLLGLLAAVFIFDSRATRLSLAILNGTGFLAVKILHHDPAATDGFPTGRLAVNVLVFLVGYYCILEIIRTVHQNHQQALERQNAALSESRRRLDEEHNALMALTRELKVANQAKERLFSLLAHDLRGPIGNLKNALELLHRGDLTPEDFRKMVTSLKVDVDLAFECLESLLLWSARQLREIKPVPSEVPLLAAAQQALALLDHLATLKQITIRNTIPAEARVWADQTQVASIFRNLLSNAMKFTPAGGKVELSAEEKGDCWSIAVSDTGVGMTPEQVRRISQADIGSSHPGTDNEKGFGLGLQICREFINGNRGTLSVESRVGRGSILRFTLPRTGHPEQTGTSCNPPDESGEALAHSGV